MTADAILIMRFIFVQIWRLFTSWYIPGTRVTPAAMAMFMLAFSFVLRHLSRFLGGDDSGGNGGSGSPRSGGGSRSGGGRR